MSLILILVLVVGTLYFAMTILIWFVAGVVLLINALFGLSLRNNAQAIDASIFWFTVAGVVITAYIDINLIGTAVFVGLCTISCYFKVYRAVLMRHNGITEGPDDDDRSYVSLRR